MNRSVRFLIKDYDRWSKGLSGFRTRLARFLSQILYFSIGVYRTIGTTHLGGQCRFQPSCSAYAEEAIKIHPPAFAAKLIIKRILKCRPGGPYGFDPVPGSTGERNLK